MERRRRDSKRAYAGSAPMMPSGNGCAYLPWGESAMENETVFERPQPLAALCIDFVAKPEEVHHLKSTLPAAFRGGLGQVAGFVGCLVMISDREARLVSVTTFWARAEGTTCRSKRARWVQALLIPYVDHCLRVQTLDAYVGASRSAGGGIVERESVPRAKARSEKELSFCVV